MSDAPALPLLRVLRLIDRRDGPSISPVAFSLIVLVANNLDDRRSEDLVCTRPRSYFGVKLGISERSVSRGFTELERRRLIKRTGPFGGHLKQPCGYRLVLAGCLDGTKTTCQRRGTGSAAADRRDKNDPVDGTKTTLLTGQKRPTRSSAPPAPSAPLTGRAAGLPLRKTANWRQVVAITGDLRRTADPTTTEADMKEDLKRVLGARGLSTDPTTIQKALDASAKAAAKQPARAFNEAARVAELRQQGRQLLATKSDGGGHGH